MAQNATSIAIAFDPNFRHAASIFRGVADYLSDHQLDWRLIPLQIGFEAKLHQLAQSRQLAGAIGTFVSDNWLTGLQEYQVQAVNLFNFSKITCVPTVTIHDFALGQIAAKHLLRQGARHFAFYGSDSIHFTQLRLAGFKSKIPNQPIHLWNPSNPFKQNLQACAEPSSGPLGIFCNSDRLARS